MEPPASPPPASSMAAHGRAGGDRAAGRRLVGGAHLAGHRDRAGPTLRGLLGARARAACAIPTASRAPCSTPGRTVARLRARVRALPRAHGHGAAGRRRLDRPAPLVVCTHRRSAYLPGLLEAVRPPRPAARRVHRRRQRPRCEDSRQVIEAAGATYVREDRRGLDHARTAGLRAAGGELVAFTDDDCVPAVSLARGPRRAVRAGLGRRRHGPGLRLGARLARPAAIRARGWVQPGAEAPQLRLDRRSRRSTPAPSARAPT